MNIKARLEHIAHLLIKDRAMGQTTMIAKAAKETGGMVLARTHDHAKQIERSHGVTSRSMEVNLEGYSGPFYLDHYATSGLLMKAADKIGLLEETLKAERAEKERMSDELAQAQEALKKFQSGAV